MLAEIITIGDEILIGQIVDSNSAYIAKALNKIGISVYQITSIQDDGDHISKALKEAEDNADIIITTGGLGPTKDDITKLTICNYLNDKLISDTSVLANVEMLFKKYIKTPISDLNRQQALVPSRAEVLMNRFGTAPGLWNRSERSKDIIVLPGVPYEMKALIDNDVIPRLRERYNLPFIMHKTLLTYGLGESTLAERLESWENSLPSYIKLAYLPNLGRVRLRLSAKNKDRELVESEMEKQIGNLIPLIEDIFVGYEDEDSLVSLLSKILIVQNKTLSVAESCTGGKLSEMLTEKSGASAFYRGGVTSYATDTKISILGVDKDMISKHSVVSKEVVEAMAIGAIKLFNSDYSIATTGNAGPTKGDSDEEVGTVFIAIASKNKVITEKFSFGNQRIKVVGKSVNKALEMLYKEILKKA